MQLSKIYKFALQTLEGSYIYVFWSLGASFVYFWLGIYIKHHTKVWRFKWTQMNGFTWNPNGMTVSEIIEHKKKEN